MKKFSKIVLIVVSLISIALVSCNKDVVSENGVNYRIVKIDNHEYVEFWG